jgi:capsular polysaccharide biosynthesis protein
MKKREITIKDLAEILLPKLWLVVVISIVASAAMYLYSSFIKKDTYTSSSLLYVHSKISDKEITGDNVSVAQGMVEVYKVMLKSDKFLKPVVAEINQNEGYENVTVGNVRSMMSVSQVDETEIFSIAITAPTPEMACVVLNAVHNNTISKIKDFIPNALEITAFEDPILPEDSKSIYPNAKNEIRNSVIAFLGAAVVSVVAIWVYAFFDVVIRDKKKLVDNVDIPILGVIPNHELPVTSERRAK